MNSSKWYAVYTRSRQEKMVAKFMEENGHKVYLPLITVLRQWSDRKKKVVIPLISSYVFVNVSEREYYDVLNTEGAVCFVTFEGKAAPIRDSEIETMRMAVDGGLKIELVSTPLKPGEKVKVVAGPMKGAEGEYVETKHKCNFIINLYHVGFSLKVEIHASDVVKL